MKSEIPQLVSIHTELKLKNQCHSGDNTLHIHFNYPLCVLTTGVGGDVWVGTVERSEGALSGAYVNVALPSRLLPRWMFG